MKTDRARSQQEIFAEMHRELRAWNPQVPESAERLDPILRIVLQLYSSQLAKIDARVDRLWDVASNELLQSLYPECKRWPVPAHTVMRCEPIDPVVTVDPHTRFYYREKREGGQTFFFSSQREEKLVKAELKQALLRVGSTVVDITGGQTAAPPPPVGDLPFSKSVPGQIYLGIEHGDQAGNFAGAPIFLSGDNEALNQIRWGYWYPSSGAGSFYEDSSFCPGLTCSVDDIVHSGRINPLDWGGLRSSADLFKHLENNFVIFPENFANTWEVSPAESELAKLMAGAGVPLPPDGDRLYWIRIDLPPGGDKQLLRSPLTAHFGTFIATNKNELTLFKHTGANRVVEIELPERIENILEVTAVVDSSGQDYRPYHVVEPGSKAGAYSLENRKDRLVLWFDFSARIDPPPESLTVTYSVTAGTAANGIEAGQISELYENHPGLDAVENVLQVRGAVPAKTEEQIITEVSARLRGRDRALSFQEISLWTTSFDSRIGKAECTNGIERAGRGVRRCIVVTISVAKSEFYSNDELELLRTRLGNFLKSRAPVNTRFKVEIAQV